MAKATIDVQGMSRIVTGIQNGIDTLDSARSSLRTTLSHYYLDTSRTAALQGPADWARDELPSLRRRLALAQALEGSNPSWSKGTVQLDDVTDITSMDPDKAQQAGREAAEALKNGGKPDDDLIDQIVDLQNDPYFAAGFAQALDADELADVVVKLSYNRTQQNGSQTQEQLDEANAWYGRLLNGMSTTMATATRNTGDLALPSDYAQSWLDTIEAEVPTSPYYDGGDGRQDRANALAVLLNSGRYGDSFLSTIASGVYDYEREVGDERGSVWAPKGSDLSSEYGVYDAEGRRFRDPMTGVMNALGNNPQVAQTFFSGGDQRDVEIDGKDVTVDERLAYLVLDRRWDIDPTNGGALGSALEAATTKLRDSGYSGRVSAEIASQTFALIGDKTGDGQSDGFLFFGQHEGWKMWDGLRPHVSQMLASYSADAYRVIVQDQDDFADGWSRDGSGELFDDDMPYGAVMDKDLLARLVGTLGENQDDVTPFLTGLFQAQNLAAHHGLTNALTNQPNAAAILITGGVTDDSNPAFTNGALVTSWALDQAFKGDKSDEEFQKKRAEAIADALSIASAIPYIPEIKPKWLKFAVDQGKDATIDGIKDSVSEDSGATYTDLSNKFEQQLVDATMNQLLQSGYFSDEAVQGAADRDVNFRPPPADAIDPGPPPSFKTSSSAYHDWYDRSAMKTIVQDTVVNTYRARWGLPQ